MPLIDLHCRACEAVAEVFRHHSAGGDRLAGIPPTNPPCPKCDSADTEQVHLPRSARVAPPAVVVYLAPDGTYRVPGETGGSSTAKYDRLGYRRVEARGWAEVRALEKNLNQRERGQLQRVQERKQELRERGEHARRSELFHRMQSMSTIGRDLARAAIARTNNKPRGGSSSTDPGLHVEAYSQNRSNR